MNAGRTYPFRESLPLQREGGEAGRVLHPVAGHRQRAKDKPDTEAALARLAQFNARTVAVSRTPDGKTGSHVLAYADKAGATEANALFGTPDEINSRLDAIRNAGAEYVLLVVSGGIDQLRCFKRDIMPNFSTPSTAAPVTFAAE